MDESTIIRSGDLFVTPVVSDETLAKAYFQMKEEGTLERVFYQGIPTLRQFLIEFLTEGRRVTLGCFRDVGKPEPEYCGMGWVLASVSMDGWTRSETGMCFSRNQSRQTDNLKFGQLMMESFFRRYDIDVLFGCTPSANRAALKYARALGMTLNGPIPGLCCWRGEISSGWISTMLRSEWPK